MWNVFKIRWCHFQYSPFIYSTFRNLKACQRFRYSMAGCSYIRRLSLQCTPTFSEMSRWSWVVRQEREFLSFRHFSTSVRRLFTSTIRSHSSLFIDDFVLHSCQETLAAQLSQRLNVLLNKFKWFFLILIFVIILFFPKICNGWTRMNDWMIERVGSNIRKQVMSEVGLGWSRLMKVDQGLGGQQYFKKFPRI